MLNEKVTLKIYQFIFIAAFIAMGIYSTIKLAEGLTITYEPQEKNKTEIQK